MEEYLKIVKSISEKTRIRILALLHQAKEICVSDLVDILQESQYKVSRHLKILQEAEMVISSRKGRWIYYQLNENKYYFNDILLKAVKHITSDTLKEDLQRLKQKQVIRINS
jgi:ArsR family transcriptional regulator, arsenate/arsenite/antimonite-responsive transcriptional repressor